MCAVLGHGGTVDEELVVEVVNTVCTLLHIAKSSSLDLLDLLLVSLVHVVLLKLVD